MATVGGARATQLDLQTNAYGGPFTDAVAATKSGADLMRDNLRKPKSLSLSQTVNKTGADLLTWNANN